MHFVRMGMPALVLLSAAMAGAQDIKVAIVDVERAVALSAEGKKAQEKLKAEYDAKSQVIQQKQKEIDSDQNRLKTQERVLSDSAKAELTRNIQRKQTDLERMTQDAQTEIQQLQQDLFRPILQAARTVINSYSAEKGFTILIDVSLPESNVVWWNKANDITDEVVKLIDAAMAAAKPEKSETTAAPEAKTTK